MEPEIFGYVPPCGLVIFVDFTIFHIDLVQKKRLVKNQTRPIWTNFILWKLNLHYIHGCDAQKGILMGEVL